MARDRLAAMRAQQGGVNTNSDAPISGGGQYSGRRAANPYAQQDGAYEMASPKSDIANIPAPSGGMGDGMSAFYSEISSIQDSLRTFNENVTRIGDLHSRSLNVTDDSAAQRNAAQLDDLVQDTSALSTTLKRRIQALAKQRVSGRDGQIRTQQTNLVKTKFVESIQQYQTVEQQYRQKSKQRMERQFKIVKPDATPDEVRQVVNDDSGGQIFSQALLNTNQYGASKAAYKEVQDRHQDIKRIEQTLAELAQLFNDMSILVEQQDEQIDVIADQATKIDVDVEAGLGYTEKAVDSAKAARKKRWICFILLIVILIIIAIIIAVVVTNNMKK